MILSGHPKGPWGGRSVCRAEAGQRGPEGGCGRRCRRGRDDGRGGQFGRQQPGHDAAPTHGRGGRLLTPVTARSGPVSAIPWAHTTTMGEGTRGRAQKHGGDPDGSLGLSPLGTQARQVDRLGKTVGKQGSKAPVTPRGPPSQLIHTALHSDPLPHHYSAANPGLVSPSLPVRPTAGRRTSAEGRTVCGMGWLSAWQRP